MALAEVCQQRQIHIIIRLFPICIWWNLYRAIFIQYKNGRFDNNDRIAHENAYLFEVRGWFRARSSLFLRKLFLFYLPFLLAGLDVNCETLRSIFSSTILAISCKPYNCKLTKYNKSVQLVFDQLFYSFTFL